MGKQARFVGRVIDPDHDEDVGQADKQKGTEPGGKPSA